MTKKKHSPDDEFSFFSSFLFHTYIKWLKNGFSELNTITWFLFFRNPFEMCHSLGKSAISLFYKYLIRNHSSVDISVENEKKKKKRVLIYIFHQIKPEPQCKLFRWMNAILLQLKSQMKSAQIQFWLISCVCHSFRFAFLSLFSLLPPGVRIRYIMYAVEYAKRWNEKSGWEYTYVEM